MSLPSLYLFFNDTATTEIYTLSLHDALPISRPTPTPGSPSTARPTNWGCAPTPPCFTVISRRPGTGSTTCAGSGGRRSEEHTSELQSHSDLVCRLLLEKKKRKEHKTYQYDNE